MICKNNWAFDSLPSDLEFHRSSNSILEAPSMQLGIPDVARIMQVPERTVHCWIKNDGLPVHQFSGKRYIHRLALFEWATNRDFCRAPAVLAENPSGAAERAALAAAVELGGVRYDIPAADAESALRGVAERLNLPRGIDRQTVADLLLGRSIVGLISAGDGFSLPHPRYPIVLPLWDPRVALCRFERPVVLESNNDKPTETMFVITAPTVRRHQVLLTYLMAMLQDDGLKSLIREQAACEAIVDFVRGPYDAASAAPLNDVVGAPAPLGA
jgi:mannitol/fructose-specific phosphotransferase system IIA component (Ntr-type)